MALNNIDSARATLRLRLLQERRDWFAGPQAPAAQQALHERLWPTLTQLEPACLGLYWPMPGEFNPMGVAMDAQKAWGCRLALPYARKNPVEMQFRLWNGSEQGLVKDECGIPAAGGKEAAPDVVLVPCLGFTEHGWRLGYGGGYFDRYLAAHPEVTPIGVAWEMGRLPEAELAPQTHDVALMAVLTECNTWTA